MLKKSIFFVFVLISLCAATWAYFALKQKKEPSVSVIEHIPKEAFCIIESKNYTEFATQLTHQNLIWSKLLDHPNVSRTQMGLHFLDSLINAHSEIKEVLKGNAIYWSFIKNSESIEHLIQFKLKEKSNEVFFNNFFQKAFQKDNTISSCTAYKYLLNKQAWLITCENGIVYLSSNTSLLEKAIHLEVKESIANNRNYAELIKTNGNQPIQFYFNHQSYDLFSKTHLNRQSCFNLDVQLNQITLNGYSLNDSLSFLNTLQHQEANRMDLFEQLPNNPAFIKAVTLSDAKLFYNQLEIYNSKQFSVYNNRLWDSVNELALYPIKNEFLENIDQEIVNASYVINELQEDITVFKLRDLEKMQPLLDILMDSVIKTENGNIIKIKQAFTSLLSVFQPLIKYRYAIIKDNQLVLASNFETVELYQKSCLNADLIGKNSRFMSYAQDNLLQEGNYFYYENVDQIRKNNLVSLFHSQDIIQTEGAISHISCVVKNYKNFLQMRINATHAHNQSSEANTNSDVLWSFSADSSIYSPISIFTNHLSQEKELCFQDVANQLYLISSTGNIVWKKMLDEPIKSTIYTVDIFKNNKYQLLFNTENYLHLIDRNGNEVEGYPKKMPSKITSNITLLDYDNNKDYRIFLACADKKIYNFSIFGIKTEGFIPVSTEAVVELPMYYTKLGQSDYLITADVAGKIYAFSRKGLGRIDFNNRTILKPSKLYLSIGNQLSNSKIIYVDDLDNTLNKISFSDTKQSIKIGDELSGYKIAFELIDDDNQVDIMMFGDGGLFGYDLFSNKLFEIFNTNAFYDDAQMVSTTTGHFIFAFDKVGQKIDVFSVDAKQIRTISSVSKKPLITQLYGDGKSYIITTNNQQVNCIKLD